jgi:histidyl-tRNA synthetase
MRFQAPRGTEDVLPQDSHKWQRLEETFRRLVHRYGYREIRTPTFEDTDLFVRSSGETSDIVSKQMYSFVDKGDRNITLKPEGTAPAVRAVIEHNLCPPGTVERLYYITPIYRYERPQKGRLREAHQVGLELLGSNSPAADAEVIEITVRFYQELGLKNVQVLLNSLGRGDCRRAYRDAVLEHASDFLATQPEEAQERAHKNPLRLLDSKDPNVQALMKTCPPVLDYLEEDAKARFDELQRLLQLSDVPFQVAPEIVRGLDYYTETVFEVQSTSLGAQSALCGGGRYDDLVQQLGGSPTPSVGVAMGIERALIVLEAEQVEMEPRRPDVFVVSAGEGLRDEVIGLVSELRADGHAALWDIDSRSMKSQLRQADRSGARFAVIIGEDELAAQAVTLRNLAGSEQHQIPRAELIDRLKT